VFVSSARDLAPHGAALGFHLQHQQSGERERIRITRRGGRIRNLTRCNCASFARNSLLSSLNLRISSRLAALLASRTSILIFRSLSEVNYQPEGRQESSFDLRRILILSLKSSMCSLTESSSLEIVLFIFGCLCETTGPLWVTVSV
jgi:hypothetical protein